MGGVLWVAGEGGFGCCEAAPVWRADHVVSVYGQGGYEQRDASWAGNDPLKEGTWTGLAIDSDIWLFKETPISAHLMPGPSPFPRAK